jgi:predicted DNA-binding transcriptional regulator AlpA
MAPAWERNSEDRQNYGALDTQGQHERDAMGEPRLARRLSVSQALLRKWRRAGGGPPFVRLGRRVVYLWSDVEAWLETKRQGG